MNPDGFLDRKNRIAVVGASPKPDKWGSRIYRTLKSSGFDVYGINPKYKRIGQDACYPNLVTLPEKPDVVITVVPPGVTEQIAKECKKLKISMVWMQPGSESEKAVNFCKRNRIRVMHDSCFVVDGLREGFG